MTEQELKAFAEREAANGKTCAEPPPLNAQFSRLIDRAKETQTAANAAGVREAARTAGVAVATLRKDLGERYTPSRVALDRFELYDKNQNAVLATVQEYIGKLGTHVANGQSLILYGYVGTGKDRLLALTLYAAAALGFSARWFSCQDLYGNLRDRMGSNEREADLIRTLVDPQVIGLSDPIPPADDLTPWRMEFLYRVVDRRYRALNPTLLTINAKTPADADQKLGQQVFDRLQESAVMVPCFWQSFRERKKS